MTNKEKILKQKILELEKIEQEIKQRKALIDPWVFLTGYELGEKWTPGPSNGFVYTLDEHDSNNPIKHFPNKEYFWHITKLWLENEKIVIAKSRQMMITWLIVALNLWKFITKNGQLIFFQSKKEYDSAQIVERAKTIYDNLPFKKQYPATIKYLHIISPERYSKIVGIPQGGAILRQYTSSSILCDEAAFQEQAEDAYSAAKPTIEGGGNYTLISTADGKKNFFYRLYTDNLDDEETGKDDQAEMVEIMKGLKIRHNKNGFLAIRLHYTADPDKDPDTEQGLKWYKKTREGYPTHIWNKEYEIDFSTGSGKGIYVEDFLPKLSIRKDLEYNKDLPLYRVWDFGYRHPAVLWAQINEKGQLCILREEQGLDETLFKFAPRIIDITEEYFPGARIRDFCDPAGVQKNDKSEKTSIDILKSFHIRPKYVKINVSTSIEYIRKLMIQQPDTKETRLLVHPRCKILIDGFQGGYIFKKDTDKPVEDGYYEHTQDCLRYLVSNLIRKLNLNKDDKNEKIKKDKSGKRYYRRRYINRYNSGVSSTPYGTGY